MQNLFKMLNSVQTQLFTWGNPFDSNGLDVVICVTGNPGIPDFYIDFASEIHKNSGLPICVVGHAGHVEVPDEKSNVLKNNYNLFDLEGQIKHKLDLLHNHIDKKSKLHLIGHSIGAWMIIELLQRDEKLVQRVSSVQFLFPTIQRMAESRNGRVLNGIVRKLNALIIFIVMLVSLLPQSLQTALVSLYLKYSSIPVNHKDRVLKYINPKVNEKVLFLAYNEMDCVKTLNSAAIDKIKHLTNVIYGSKDGWAPVTYMEDLKQFQPELQMKEVDIRHAFVLKSSERVAEMVVDFIRIK